jgi:hypothetical protein
MTFKTFTPLLLTAAFAAAQAPKLAVYPPQINLQTKGDSQSLVVQVTEASGITRDVTAAATYAFANDKLAKRAGNVLTPLSDGVTELTITAAGQTVKVPVTVAKAAEDRPVSFKLDVMPVFLRAGCNSGGCHGAARGKDGFRLSLFGYDPDGDHHRLTREFNGRRVNLALPKESLLLEKASGQVPHTGGKKIEANDQYYAAIQKWIEADCPQDAPTVATPVSLEVFPPGAVLDGKGEKQKLTVRAKYSDGTDRDVTTLALYMSSNDTAAKIDPDGTVTAGERGEAFVMARFHTFTIGVPVITLPRGAAFQWGNTPEKNYVDTLVNTKLKSLRVEPSAVCDDSTFVRRVFIDITGKLPTMEETKKFLDSKDADKRAKLIDDLLDRKEFAELWVMKWADLLQLRSSNDVPKKAILQYHAWLQDKIARNVPTNEWVRELLSANGSVFKNPPANYFQLERDILKVSENVAQVFLGMRVQCAQCHNHPFDRWTMNDYYGFAAFFSQIGRKATEDPKELVIFSTGNGEVRHPVTNQPTKPKFLGGVEPDLAGKDRRLVMAEWLTSPENPYFAKNLGNIVWAHFLGTGIVDAVDDVRISNPPSNGPLLDELGKRFVDYKYDFKKLVRDICTSNTYQRSTHANATNATDTRNFAKASVRRIRAETLLDCISEVTEAKNKFPGLPLGARAVQIADGLTSNYFLNTFGRPQRETVCSCEVRMEPTLSQSLHLMNGDTVSPKIRGGGLVNKWIAEKRTPEAMIEEMYWRALSRPPSQKEMKALTDAVAAAPKGELNKTMEDVFWSVLNSREFMFNH